MSSCARKKNISVLNHIRNDPASRCLMRLHKLPTIMYHVKKPPPPPSLDHFKQPKLHLLPPTKVTKEQQPSERTAAASDTLRACGFKIFRNRHLPSGSGGGSHWLCSPIACSPSRFSSWLLYIHSVGRKFLPHWLLLPSRKVNGGFKEGHVIRVFRRNHYKMDQMELLLWFPVLTEAFPILFWCLSKWRLPPFDHLKRQDTPTVFLWTLPIRSHEVRFPRTPPHDHLST